VIVLKVILNMKFMKLIARFFPLKRASKLFKACGKIKHHAASFSICMDDGPNSKYILFLWCFPCVIKSFGFRWTFFFCFSIEKELHM